MTEFEPQIALLTGATGFVGSHLVRQLVRDGWRVHAVARSSSSLDHLGEAIGCVTVHQYNGTTEKMLAIVREAKPDIVFHLASLVMPEHQPSDVVPLIQSNLLLGTQLLEAMKCSGVTRLVNTGTTWQHYHDEAYNPVNLYAATKQAFNDILRYYLETSDLKVITLKLFDTYGPNDPRSKLIPLLLKVSHSTETLAMSPGAQLIDLVYIDDVVEAYVIAGASLIKEKVRGHKEYTVGSGTPLSLHEVVRVYETTTGRQVKVRWGGRGYRSREVMTPYQFGTPLPGWSSKVNLQQGIERVFNNYSK